MILDAIHTPQVRPEYHLTAENVPDGMSGDVAVQRFEVTEEEAAMFRARMMVQGRWTSMRPGTYTGLWRGESIWMSDTLDEQIDMYGVYDEVLWRKAETVLINGLGLGVLVNALLHVDHVRRIDVVEIDPDVIELVAPTYVQMANERDVELSIHEGDALDFVVPDQPTKWDVVWHDIWQHISTDNWSTMSTLHRRYGRRARWQSSWKRETVKIEREREKRERFW